ncbi:poly-gamma-glutamate synthesis protein (capsule biosynthesis protein) [Monoraphidium neglectum]|uniref:Poly-gamma-glutamate synthesis protein (Capsule biosynthesis protein) n=1 Tax=Monoraphidium neglectum TaxID=145388 RepID=A0A0D2M159_9CHLO|nr:poly-gamma-glutamate synthesis protein (capsule biosynthesis protein) [Monoraphidium neglectum]KIY95186.1 poly-gamma-glutamate synthesis protein (capsule biosynthesis protein) [Monoraphidium neglectum]|eukprot:XP_013894206.1 poly-gamma-glutamate synthesis protein (capsule biosynthesis protein) [Monoraphidium neglectum]
MFAYSGLLPSRRIVLSTLLGAFTFGSNASGATPASPQQAAMAARLPGVPKPPGTVNGKLPERRGPEYPWGVALQDMEAMRPDVRVINLETAMTTHDKPWPDKGINYRCHPGNVATLKAGGVQVAGLANNHCLDWQIPGLMETLETLEGAGIMVAGAGRNASQACRPTVIQLPPAADGQPSRSAAAAAAADADTAPAGPEDVDGPRVLVWGLGHESSGVYDEWEAGEARPGVCMTDLSAAHAARVGAAAAAAKRPGSDIAVVSLHVGSNWGFTVPEAQRQFTRALIQGWIPRLYALTAWRALACPLPPSPSL